MEIKQSTTLVQKENPTEAERVKENELKRDLYNAYRDEDVYWSQKSRINWLKFGDQNTAFFHASTIQRQGFNRIAKLKDDEGVWIENEEQIAK